MAALVGRMLALLDADEPEVSVVPGEFWVREAVGTTTVLKTANPIKRAIDV